MVVAHELMRVCVPIRCEAVVPGVVHAPINLEIHGRAYDRPHLVKVRDPNSLGLRNLSKTFQASLVFLTSSDRKSVV